MRYQELTEGKKLTIKTRPGIGFTVWQNPSHQQLINFLNKVGELRGFEDDQTKDFYVWDATEANHGMVHYELGTDVLRQTGLYLSVTDKIGSWTWNDALRKIGRNLYIGIGGDGRTARNQTVKLQKLISNKKIKFALGL